MRNWIAVPSLILCVIAAGCAGVAIGVIRSSCARAGSAIAVPANASAPK